MSQLVMWNLIVGFLLPHLIAVIQQPTWSQRARVIVTSVVCVLFGGGTAYFNGVLDNWHDVVGSILIVGVAAITFYNNLWKQTGIPQSIERATSGSKNQWGSMQTDYAITVMFSVAAVTLVVVSVGLLGFLNGLGALLYALE